MHIGSRQRSAFRAVCVLTSTLSWSATAWSAPPIEVALPNIDQNIAAGERYVLVGDYNRFVVYDRTTGSQLPLTGTPLEPSSNAIEGGGAATLFADLWTGTGSKNVNLTLPHAAKGLPCDPTHPVASFTETPPGIVKLADKGWPTSACINDFYDTRVAYDTVRKRFWIVSAGRNQLWSNICTSENPSKAGAPPKGTCAAVNAQAARFEVAAVSVGDDPRGPYHTFVVAKDYADFPTMKIHDDYAFFSHHGEGTLHVYDADKMAAGTLTALTPAFKTSDFNSGALRVARHHFGSDGVTYIAAVSGSRLSVYGLRSPHPAGTKRSALLTPATYTDAKGRHFDSGYGIADVVHFGKYLWITTDTASNNDHDTLGSKVLVWRIPVSLGSHKKSVVLDAANVKSWELQDPLLSFDYPSMDVSRDGTAIVVFRAYGKGKGNHSRYALLYEGDKNFRASTVLHEATSSGVGGRIDYQTTCLDPADRRLVWTAQRYSQGMFFTSIPVPCLNTVCDGECVDTQQSNTHCGSCGRVCGKQEECENGRCIGG